MIYKITTTSTTKAKHGVDKKLDVTPRKKNS